MARPTLNPSGGLSPEELVEATRPEIEGSALTASTADVTGGALEAQAAATRQGLAAPLEQAKEVDARSFGEAFQAVLDDSPTAWVAELAARTFEDTFNDYDPNFDPNRTMTEVISQYGLEENNETIRYLASAGTEGEMAFRASDLARNQENQRILAQHGGVALLGMLDPLSLLTDVATFGATKAFKFSRLASGIAGAGAVTAPTALADYAGRETSGLDYVIGAAIGSGAFSLFGGEAANRIARGEGNWYGRATPVTESVGGTAGGRVAEFVSEFDRLAMADRPGARTTRTTEVVDGEEVVTETLGRDDLMRMLADDPVRRGTYLNNDNASAYLRMYANEMDGLNKTYQDALEDVLKKEQGFGWVARKVDLQGRYIQARDGVESQVAEEIIRRDVYWNKFGRPMPTQEQTSITRLADLYENMMNRMGEIARDAGVRGFEDFTPRQGYFHRSWNAAAITAGDPKLVRGMIAQSAMRGIEGLDEETANLIAKSIYDRAVAKLRNEGIDFFGTLGKTDTDMLREMLRDSGGLSAARIDSIMGRVEQNLAERGTVKYGKSRLPLDMTVSTRMPDGSVVRMTDFIDTDLARLADNYVNALSGRSALAKAGIGGDDSSIEAFKRQYADTLKGLPEDVRQDRMLTLDGILSDFTGERPLQNVLGQGAQRLKSVADASMLSASGLWQVAEYATMAHRYGLANTMSEFMRQFPGVAGTLRKMGRSPDLRDEMESVLKLDLARDVRVRPWLRQHDLNLASKDTALDRALHAGKQAVPYLNAMKFVHKHQARMNANLALNTIARAAKGDSRALRIVREYGLKGDQWERVKAAVERNVTYTGKNAQQMNWAAWGSGDVDAAMNAALRMMDDAILFGRPGQGAGTPILARSQIGQILGQFRSFVAYAHNKLLRGTLENGGVKGLAALLAFQYPLTGLLVMANEARKGNLDLSEEGIQDIAKRTIGYTAGLGLAADAIGIVGLTGGRGGLSIPITGVFDSVPTAFGGAGKIMQGEFQSGAGDIAKAASMVVPGLNILPGTALALDAMQED